MLNSFAFSNSQQHSGAQQQQQIQTPDRPQNRHHNPSQATNEGVQRAAEVTERSERENIFGKHENCAKICIKIKFSLILDDFVYFHRSTDQHSLAGRVN